MAVRDPRTEWLRVKIYRGMTPARRAQIIYSLNQTMRELSLAIIRQMHPDWSAEEMQREWRRRRLPRELFEKLEHAHAEPHAHDPRS